jgi:hypothetical protein
MMLNFIFRLANQTTKLERQLMNGAGVLGNGTNSFMVRVHGIHLDFRACSAELVLKFILV